MSHGHFSDLQRRFVRIISQPGPIAEALRSLAESEPCTLPLSDWIAAPSEELAIERIGVYARMYFARLRDSLREDFASFATLVSAERFDRIAEAYCSAHPSDNPSLRHHGRHFPEFVRAGLLARAPVFEGVRADAADLCALEWARIEVFDAPSGHPLRLEELGRLDVNGWQKLRLRLVPAVRQIRNVYRVVPLWSAIQSRVELPCVEPASEPVLVWRRGHKSYHRSALVEEADAITLLEDGAPFEELCARFSRRGESTESAAGRTLAALLQWVADEIVQTCMGEHLRERLGIRTAAAAALPNPKPCW
ncbi:MAG TPA: putative DNA-binding domain-containing protein [Polyangiaceae bacterium]